MDNNLTVVYCNSKIKFKIKSEITVIVLMVTISYILTIIGISDSFPVSMAIIWTLFFSFILYKISLKVIRTRYDFFLVFGSYILRIVFLIKRYGGEDITNPSRKCFEGDDMAFWNAASQLYAGVRKTARVPYERVLALLMKLFGQNIYLLTFINVLAAIGMVVIVLTVLNKLNVGGNKRILLVAITTMLPYGIFISTIMLREGLYFFLTTLSFVTFAEYVCKKNNRYLIMAYMSILPAIILHPGFLSVVVIYILFSFFHNRLKGVFNIVCFVVATGILLFFLTKWPRTSIYFDTTYLNTIISTNFMKSTSDYNLNSRSIYLKNTNISSISDLVWYTPLRTFYYLFSPLPMNWRGISDIGAFLLDSCIWIYIFIKLAKGINILKMKKIRGNDKDILVKYKVAWCAIWILLFSAIIFGAGTMAAGTAIRHRDSLIGIAIVALAYTYVPSKDGTDRKNLYEYS